MKKLLLLLPLILLSACNEEEKALNADPKIENVGVFDGCDVKFVNRGWATESFFLAKCPGQSQTTTNNAMVPHGKSQQLQRRTAVFIETSPEEQKLKELTEKKL